MIVISEPNLMLLGELTQPLGFADRWFTGNRFATKCLGNLKAVIDFVVGHRGAEAEFDDVDRHACVVVFLAQLFVLAHRLRQPPLAHFFAGGAAGGNIFGCRRLATAAPSPSAFAAAAFAAFRPLGWLSTASLGGCLSIALATLLRGGDATALIAAARFRGSAVAASTAATTTPAPPATASRRGASVGLDWLGLHFHGTEPEFQHSAQDIIHVVGGAPKRIRRNDPHIDTAEVRVWLGRGF